MAVLVCCLQAIVAVGHIEDWTWEVTSRFLLSSELIGSCWREFRQQQGSQIYPKAAYGLRRFVRSGSHLRGILDHVRNIARNPTGETISIQKDDTLEVCAHPHHDADRELSDFYKALTVEKTFHEETNAGGSTSEELTPDTDAGMAALRLQGGSLGRICKVVETLLKSSLDTDSAGLAHKSRAEQQAPLNPSVIAAAATAGYLPAGENDENATVVTAVPGPSTSAVGDVAAPRGILPAQPSDPEEDDVVFEATVPCAPKFGTQGVCQMLPTCKE